MGTTAEQNYKGFWQEAYRLLRAEYMERGQEDDFSLWFNMGYVGDEKNCITVAVPSDFMWREMVSRGYVSLMEQKIRELTAQDVHITYVVRQVARPEPEPVPAVETRPAQPSQGASSVPTRQGVQPEYAEIPRKQGTDSAKKAEEKPRHPQLNEDYTFDAFVMGDNNAFAYNASLSVSKNPGSAYNPLLLYGGVGLGKTHLMQSIGNYVWQNGTPATKICYISSENLMNEFTSALRDQTIEKFKNKYRKLDLLLLDDIQFLEKKEGLQQELFYTFEALFNAKKQMVFTCDRPITDIKNIDDRLRNRFTRGLSVDMKAPDYETRRAIIQKKLEITGKRIPAEVADLIAKNVQTNVRDLESALNKITGYTEMINADITPEKAQELLRDTFSQVMSGAISVETIQKVVADHYNISLSDIKSKKRNKQFMIPRQIAIYLSRELTEYSYPDLGTEFGGKDHTTMMHSYEKIADQLKIDSSLEATMQSLIREIKDFKR